MSKVFTANVFLTFSQEAMEKFFYTANTNSFKEVISLFTKEDIESSVIASPYTNSNLISFDYSFGANFQGQQALTLKLTQTNSLFELWYLSKTSTDTLASNSIKEILNSENKDALNQLFAQKNYVPVGNKLFFAFGVGDDIRDWAGPFTADGAQYELNIDESGIKEITLKFSVPSNMFLRNYIESKNQLKFSDSLNRYNFIIKGKNLVHRVMNKMPIKEVDNVENYVVKLIDDYISNITNCPTIIVLPNLKKAYDAASDGEAAAIDTSELNRRAKRLDFEANESEGLRNIYKSGIVSPLTIVKKPLISEAEIAAKRSEAESLRQEAKRKAANKFTSSQKIKNKIKEAFNIKVHVLNADESGQEQKVVNTIPIPLDAKIEGDFNNNKDKDNSIFHLYFENDNSAIPNTTETLIDPYINLKLFGDSLNRAFPDLYNQEFFVENNIRLLKLWNKRGFTNNSSLNPVYIFGDRKLIANLLYLEDVIEFKDITNRFLSDDQYSSNIKTKIQLSYYRFDYFDTFKKGKSSSSFNEDVFIGDQLSLQSDTFKDIRRNGIPIFRYNLQNPNVLSLSIENNVAYRNVYDSAYQIKSASPFVNVKDGKFEEFVATFSKDKQSILSDIEAKLSNLNLTQAGFKEILTPVRELLLNNQPIAKKLLDYGLVGPRTTELMYESDLLTYDQLAVIVAASMVRKFSSNKPFIEVNSVDDAINFESSIIENLNRLSYTINLKTVPFFHLSVIPPGQKLAILAASENKIVGANNLSTGAFYTGLYRIMGFRHFIGEGEVYSEFSMIRENISVSQNSRNSSFVISDVLNIEEEAQQKAASQGSKQASDAIEKMRQEIIRQQYGLPKTTPIAPSQPLPGVVDSAIKSFQDLIESTANIFK